jgi:hypothetical protein
MHNDYILTMLRCRCNCHHNAKEFLEWTRIVRTNKHSSCSLFDPPRHKESWVKWEFEVSWNKHWWLVHQREALRAKILTAFGAPVRKGSTQWWAGTPAAVFLAAHSLTRFSSDGPRAGACVRDGPGDGARDGFFPLPLPPRRAAGQMAAASAPAMSKERTRPPHRHSIGSMREPPPPSTEAGEDADAGTASIDAVAAAASPAWSSARSPAASTESSGKGGR